LSFIPGIEITTEARIDGMTPFGIHLLAYLADPTHLELIEMLESNLNARENRMREYLANLQKDYPNLTYELVVELADEGSTLGRPDIAEALKKLGYVSSTKEAFDGIISKDSPHYVRNRAPNVLDAIRIVREAGGVPVIAHPLARSDNDKDDKQPDFFPEEHFVEMVKAGLMGLETNHIEVTSENKIILDKFAREQGLLVTGSSDYHGLERKEDNPLGIRTTTLENLKRILELGTGSKPTLNHQL
jgi:hypothetical protein